MKRLNPIGNLLGYLLTIVLFIGLGVALWLNRGLVFSPGQVSAKSVAGVIIKGYSSHADFEKQCSNCHQPITSNLATKCLECHSEVEQQVATGAGVHSQIASNTECASCHPEHRGRSFDPTKASYQLFNHTATGFSLTLHQINYDATPMQCAACHDGNSYSQIDNQPCIDCHSSHDKSFATVHVADFGENCLGCHDGQDRMLNFDHSQTGFALDGSHAQLTCLQCHPSGDVKDTPKDCSSCHTEPAAHQGEFDQVCQTCHNPQSWKPASLNGVSFEHQQNTGFSLLLHQADYSNQPMTCKSCHPQDVQNLDLQTCINCHSQQDPAFMGDHQIKFGDQCMTCHDGVDRLSNFDHDNFFVLDGKHAATQCESCHANGVYRGTSGECYQCHQEPELHAGVFGLKCAYCHNAEGWSPASLRMHVFPISHSLADPAKQLDCQTCHGENYFEYTCYNCHDHQPDQIKQIHDEAGIAEQDLPGCISCHPAGIVDQNQKTR